MNIQTVTVAPVRPELAHELGRLASDPSQTAWPAELNYLVPIEPIGTHSLSSGLSLATGTLDVKGKALSSAQKQKRMDAYIKLGAVAGDLVKYQFPKLQGPVGTVQLLLSTYQAYEGWSDPTRTSIVQPTLDTVQALLAALNMLTPHLPPVVSSTLPVAGLLLKVGDAAYHIHLVGHDTSSSLANG
jgi:hypothetical protein